MVKAYTILELIITMLLASICISIVYTAFDVLSRSYENYRAKNVKISEYVLADKLLSRDISNAKLLVSGIDELTLELDSGFIRYAFHPDRTLRQVNFGRTDTLHVQTQKVEFFMGSEVSVDGTTADQLKLYLTLDSVKLNRVYKKFYSSADLFSQ